MALPVLPNTSNFLAVALVINRSRDGPRFVFHYPANVRPPQDRAGRADGGDDGAEDDFWADRLSSHNASDPASDETAAWDQDHHLFTESGTQIVPWEHVAGFPTKALEGMLTPARAYHKALFQLSLDPIYCVSYPIYAPENGIWRQKKKDKARHPKSAKGEEEDATPAAPSDFEPTRRSADATQPSEADRVDAKDMAAKQSAPAKGADDGEDKVSSMTMFNLVFFLNPKKHEVKELVDTMYTHIIKKVNKAYKYGQQRSDFVWKESKRILKLKDKAREESAFVAFPDFVWMNRD